MVYSSFTLQASCLGFRRCVIERALEQTIEFNLEGGKLLNAWSLENGVKNRTYY